MRRICRIYLTVSLLILVLSLLSLPAGASPGDTIPVGALPGAGRRGVATYVEGLDPTLAVGRQYLAVIGINRYQHWLPLHCPVRDVREIRDILLERYWYPYAYKLDSPLFWALHVLAALAGAFVVYPLNLWMARRCFQIWPFQGTTEERVSLPVLRSAWGALLVSIGILVASIAFAA